MLSDSILVAIPCLNEKANIASVIDKLLRDPVASNCEIVVTDGGSTDSTCQIVSGLAQRILPVHLLHNPKRFQSAGVNLAARIFGAGKRWLIRIDAHAEYPENYISNLIAEAVRMDAASVVVAMFSQGETGFQEAAATAQNSVLGTGGSGHRRLGAAGFVDHGHHALFDMNAFLAIGGYDDTQSHNEDAEFDLRLAKLGGRIWLTRATEIIYHPRKTPEDLYRQYRNYGFGRATTMLRHRMKPKLRQLVPALILPIVLLAAAAPIFPLAALPAALWLSASLLYGFFLGIRGRRLWAAASGIAAIIMHLGWSVGFWHALVRRQSALSFRLAAAKIQRWLAP